MASPRPKDLRPCDNCRRRKIRCLFASDDAVNCVLCDSRSTQCTYVQEPPRKKRALSAANDDNRTSAPPASGGHRQPIQMVASAGGRSRPSRHKSASDTPVLRDYAQLPGRSLLKETLGHQNRQSSSVLGATGDFDPSWTRFLPCNDKGEFPPLRPPQILRRAGTAAHFMMRPDTKEEMDAELANLDAIEKFVYPHGPELVKIYFRIVHPSFPILHKNVFLEKHGRSYRELTPTGLGAVYVLALNWWSYSHALSGLPKPDAKVLEAKVLTMLFDVHRRPKISDLQGGLVLTQSPNVGSWALTGHLVAMAQNLGLNADCTDWQIPDWERGVRKRVAWALYMQDKWGALVYGRGSHIRADDWDVMPLTPSDFPETAKDDDREEGSAEIEKGRQTFLRMVSLTRIVAELLDTFFTLRALKEQRTLHDMLAAAKPLQLELRAWYAAMPPGLSLEDTVPMKLSSVGYLHLAYYTAEITLHRAIMRCHGPAPAPGSLAPGDGDLYAITRRAAEARFISALEFVKRLKAEHFQSFWYFSSSISLAIIGIFAGVLCATSRTEDVLEREDYINKLAEYRWVLRVRSTGAEFMKYAVGILDAGSQLLEEQFGLHATRVPPLLDLASAPWTPNGGGGEKGGEVDGDGDGEGEGDADEGSEDTNWDTWVVPSMDELLTSVGTGWPLP
ncbi:transcriptional activator protein DAL81 [Plectosphaerella cucumerina]|uniref:Transcriptional activator protein DAL81 n=1 Tax=Plectosphaerella cucumerina TaxID=40658 RepID=A0A8K0TIW5_9PEZI|nr:transcriptional activator protein DAL81 [Plectosphaerella cucumerina]